MKRLCTFCAVVLLAVSAFAQDEPLPQILITNVDVWDGTSDSLRSGMNVLIEGNLVTQITASRILATGATVIDGSSRVLMPGLIDMHSHLCLQEGMMEGRDTYDQMAMGAMTAHFLASYLDQGFTTARDLGCNILSIAKAVNQGRIPGPRIFPAGGFISQTGGHADVGVQTDEIGRTNYLQEHGFGYIVDGRDEIMKAVRHNLRMGATHIKVMAGGGVASEWDPLHMTQYTLDEMKAAVEVAEDYGTYVTVHAYHDRSVNRAIDAGVRVIEHNFLVSEETIIRMKQEGIALSLQAVMSIEAFGNPEAITFFTADQKRKATQVNKGARQMMEWAKKHDLLIVSGGDMFGAAYANRQADNIIMVGEVGFTPLEALKQATSNAAIVLGWSGGMNPYQEGSLGVIEEGAYADMLLVDGNPLEDLEVIRDYENNFKVIIKDGKIWKNEL